MFRRFLNINHINPCHFLQQSLPSVACPILYESVTLDSLGNPQLADALTHLKKKTGDKPELTLAWAQLLQQSRVRLLNQCRPCYPCATFSSSGLSLFIALCWAKCRNCTWWGRIGKARRTACLRKRIGKAYHQNSKNESLPNIGCLSWFMFPFW